MFSVLKIHSVSAERTWGTVGLDTRVWEAGIGEIQLIGIGLTRETNIRGEVKLTMLHEGTLTIF